MATTDERLDALETRVHSLEDMRLAYEARLIAHDGLLQAAATNDSGHLIELRNLRREIEQLDGSLRREIEQLDGSLRREIEQLDGSLRREIEQLDGKLDGLQATTAAGFDAMAQLIRRGLDLPDD